MTQSRTYALGVDYGTNSVRALIVDTADGREIAAHVHPYPSGEAGILLDRRDPNVARQNPADYLDGFIASVRRAVQKARKTRGFSPDRIVGIGVDATGSTPIPVDRHGRALALLPRFRGNLAAMAWLWKDHTAHEEAARITRLAAQAGEGYLRKCGGIYSSEWYWSKILHCKRVAPQVFKAAYTWVEQSDFIPAHITGQSDPSVMPRNICAAGHKAMYHEDWGGLPSRAFLRSLDPDLAVHRDRWGERAVAVDHCVGGLTEAIARQVGLPAGVRVAAGAIDAHLGAVGSGVRPGTLVKIMGTSTCDIMVAPPGSSPASSSTPGSSPASSSGNSRARSGAKRTGGGGKLADIPGLCGIVPGSVLPGLYGLEAGQSAVGDIFNWFVQHLGREGHEALSRQAARLKPGESGLLALDWNNGNRTILVDPRLTGLLVGQTLHTTAAEIYRALVEATAFGALTIIQRIEAYGLRIDEVVNCGGISEKNPMIMRIYADVCNRPMKIAGSGQACALGAAIVGAVVGGAYRDLPAAQRRMTRVKPTVYRPRKTHAATYRKLHALYLQLHDAFGGVDADKPAAMANVMKQLIELRQQARRD